MAEVVGVAVTTTTVLCISCCANLLGVKPLPHVPAASPLPLPTSPLAGLAPHPPPPPVAPVPIPSAPAPHPPPPAVAPAPPPYALVPPPVTAPCTSPCCACSPATAVLHPCCASARLYRLRCPCAAPCFARPLDPHLLSVKALPNMQLGEDRLSPRLYCLGLALGQS